MEKRGMTQELPELEKGAYLSYDSRLRCENYEEDDMDKFIIKAKNTLKDKERQLVNKDAVTNRTN